MKRIFLVGVPRSGTTFLQSVIGCSPDVATFRESHLFARGFTKRFGRPILIRSPDRLARRFCRENGINEMAKEPFGATDWIGSWFDAQRAARYFLKVLDNSALQRGRMVWLEKTPNHLHFIDLIERAPGETDAPQFVHIVRDGAAVSRSLVAASREWAHLRPMSHALRVWRPISTGDALRHWQAGLEITLAHARRPNHHVVIYEDLIGELEQVSARLASRLAIAWSSEALSKRERVFDQIGPGESWKKDSRPMSVIASSLSREKPDELERRIDRTSYGALRKFAV